MISSSSSSFPVFYTFYFKSLKPSNDPLSFNSFSAKVFALFVYLVNFAAADWIALLFPWGVDLLNPGPAFKN